MHFQESDQKKNFQTCEERFQAEKSLEKIIEQRPKPRQCESSPHELDEIIRTLRWFGRRKKLHRFIAKDEKWLLNPKINFRPSRSFPAACQIDRYRLEVIKAPDCVRHFSVKLFTDRLAPTKYGRAYFFVYLWPKFVKTAQEQKCHAVEFFSLHFSSTREKSKVHVLGAAEIVSTTIENILLRPRLRKRNFWVLRRDFWES